MERKERRVQKEPNNIQNRYYSQLFWKFAQTEAFWYPSYITFTSQIMPETLYYKGIVRIENVHEMSKKFNDETVSKKLSVFMRKSKEYVPYYVTKNKFPERLAIIDGITALLDWKNSMCNACR